MAEAFDKIIQLMMLMTILRNMQAQQVQAIPPEVLEALKRVADAVAQALDRNTAELEKLEEALGSIGSELDELLRAFRGAAIEYIRVRKIEKVPVAAPITAALTLKRFGMAQGVEPVEAKLTLQAAHVVQEVAPVGAQLMLIPPPSQPT